MDEAGSSGRSKKIFDPSTNEFVKIVQSLGFVDGTKLIQLFFGSGSNFEPKRLFIAAPPYFCKSSNLDMVRQFFQIKEDGTVEEQLEQRHMYSTFKNLEIMQSSVDDLKQHFCAHPVLFVDFKANHLKDCNDALEHCYHAINSAYLQHKTFLQGKLKDEEDKNDCGMWWDSRKYTEVTKENVVQGLKTLCRILYTTHENKRVVILVDECDAVVRTALTDGTPRDQVEDIATLMDAVLGYVTKGDIIEQLQGVFLTGISYMFIMTDVGYTRIINAEPYTFLDDRPVHGSLIWKCYGVTKTQLEVLLKRLAVKGQLGDTIDKIQHVITEDFSAYYTRNGECMFSLWSILHYLQTGTSAASYADMIPTIVRYRPAFADLFIGVDVLKLLAGDEITIDYTDKATVPELLRLRDQGPEYSSTDLLFSLLMEVGFLTNAELQPPPSERGVKVKIPNKEIRSVFRHMLVDYQFPLGRFEPSLMKNVADVIRSVWLSCLKDEKQYKHRLILFHESLKLLFKGFEVFRVDELNEFRLQALLWLSVLYTDLFTEVVPGENEGQVTLWLINDAESFAVVCGLKVNKDNDKIHTSLYALRKMSGEEAMSKGCFAQLSSKGITDYLLLGLSMDDSHAPSISAQTSQSALEVCVSETEPRLECFSEYYRGCYNLLENKVVE